MKEFFSLVFFLFSAIILIAQNIGVQYQTKVIGNSNFYILPSEISPEITPSQDLWGFGGVFSRNKNGEVKVPNSITHKSEELEGKRTVASGRMLIRFFLKNQEVRSVIFSELELTILDTIEVPNDVNLLGKWDWGPEQAREVFAIDLNRPKTYKHISSTYLGTQGLPRDNSYDVWIYNDFASKKGKSILLKFQIIIKLHFRDEMYLLKSDKNYYIEIQE